MRKQKDTLCKSLSKIGKKKWNIFLYCPSDSGSLLPSLKAWNIILIVKAMEYY